MKLKGELLRSLDTIIFRVYTKDGEFKDYDIVAHDITIEINDPFVTLREPKTDDENGQLDYTDAVLGR